MSNATGVMVSDLSDLERRKRELELQRDIRRLERGEALSEAAEAVKKKAPGVGRLVLRWWWVAVLALLFVWLVNVKPFA